MADQYSTARTPSSKTGGGGTRSRILGGVLVALGLAALIFPAISTLAYDFYLGWLFMFGGMAMIARAWDYGGGWRLAAGSAFGVLAAAVGLAMLIFPQVAIFALTLAVAILLIGDGIASLGFAMTLRGYRASLLVLVTAMVSIGLGLLVVFNFSAVVPYMLGLILGVSLFLSGISLLAWNHECARRGAA